MGRHGTVFGQPMMAHHCTTTLSGGYQREVLEDARGEAHRDSAIPPPLNYHRSFHVTMHFFPRVCHYSEESHQHVHNGKAVCQDR
jgi:hypothetical protein